MPDAPPSDLKIRRAGPADAAAVAELHADSWRRHYRGAYSDAFLDGDVRADRLRVWSERLAEEDSRRCTLVAEAGGVVGFINTYLDDDPSWGALLDNLHVAATRRRSRIGARLVAATAEAVGECDHAGGMYVWVLEQNADGQAFYAALGAVPAGRAPVTPPGGLPGRLVGSPMKLRYAWAAPALARLARRHGAG